MSPGQWGRKVVEAYDRFRADRIIAEGNQGGEMVRHTIQTVRENVPVTIVHASRAKQARAEPVAALYEQGKVDHVGSFPELEDEMCTWEPLSGMPSPDRLDALVWALTELAIGGGPMVYAQAEEDFVCEPMRIPSIWQRVYAIDFDQRHFAVVWGAHDRLTGTIYLYDAYLAPRTDLAIHADEVKSRGGWIPGLVELQARRRSEAEGIRSIGRLADLGLDLCDVPMDPEEGVSAVTDTLTSLQLRVFSTMDRWLSAYRQYQRSDGGDLVEQDDHLMRATALLALYGPDIAISENKASIEVDYGDEDGGWSLTGPRLIAGY